MHVLKDSMYKYNYNYFQSWYVFWILKRRGGMREMRRISFAKTRALHLRQDSWLCWKRRKLKTHERLLLTVARPSLQRGLDARGRTQGEVSQTQTNKQTQRHKDTKIQTDKQTDLCNKGRDAFGIVKVIFAVGWKQTKAAIESSALTECSMYVDNWGSSGPQLLARGLLTSSFMLFGRSGNVTHTNKILRIS